MRYIILFLAFITFAHAETLLIQKEDGGYKVHQDNKVWEFDENGNVLSFTKNNEISKAIESSKTITPKVSKPKEAWEEELVFHEDEYSNNSTTGTNTSEASPKCNGGFWIILVSVIFLVIFIIPTIV